MPFQYILANLLAQNEDSVGVMFVDGSGESVHVACADFTPYQMKVVGAYLGIYLRQLNKLLEEGGLGEATLMHIEKDRLHIFTVPLPEEYFLVMVQKRPALSGHARETMRAAAEQLKTHIF